MIQLTVKEDNIREWTAVICGPKDTVYEGYSFELSINVSPDYPLLAPTMKFVTKCFHPNIHFEVLVARLDLRIKHVMQTGEICLDILKTEWSPAWSLQAACRAIIALLEKPEADSPLVRTPR